MFRTRPQTVRLLAAAGLLACVAAVWIWNSQIGHLYQVASHIERIRPEWSEFQHTNQGFERVHLYAYTGGEGMFGAYGEIWSQSDLEKLRVFMEGTHPPRPVYLGAVHVLDANAVRNQRDAMKACVEWFDSIGYSGVGRQGLERCLAAFAAGDTSKAIMEYRRTIGNADNFASAMVDLDTKGFSAEQAQQYCDRVMPVMVTMAMIMDGQVK